MRIIGHVKMVALVEEVEDIMVALDE